MPSIQQWSVSIRQSAFPKTNAFPPVSLQGKKVLDLGCGRNALAVAGSFAVGIDAFASPREELAGKLNFMRGTMERLPFADASFDFVSARGALHYSHMPTTLVEVRRILKDGGMVWGTLIGSSEGIARLLSSAMVCNVSDVAFVSYCFLNGALTAATGKQLRWIDQNRCESVSSCASIRRLLRDAGFENVVAEFYDSKVVFSATKPITMEPLVSQQIHLREFQTSCKT